jgi:hypothetical protein
MWIALGQTPVLASCQSAAYEQLTGTELAVELTVEEKYEALQFAMEGLDILVVLDDLWDNAQMTFILGEGPSLVLDQHTKSRVLVSSRVRGALIDCDIVDIGLPSILDAVQIVMAAAGLPRSAAVPARAKEICRLCKLLPLYDANCLVHMLCEMPILFNLIQFNHSHKCFAGPWASLAS